MYPLISEGDINIISKLVSNTLGIQPRQVIDTDGFKAVVFPIGVTRDDLKQFANLFGTEELLLRTGHVTGSNEPDTYTWNQILPYGIQRTMSYSDGATSSADLSTTALIPTNPDQENGSTDATTNSASDLKMADVDIAIIDTGISLIHPDLNVYRNVTFVNGTLNGNDDMGHGSHVAGVAQQETTMSVL